MKEQYTIVYLMTFLLIFSSPTLATEANVAIKEAIDNKIFFAVIVLIGVILKIGSTLFISFTSNKATIETLELEKLKFIDTLAKEKAWKSPPRRFAIEEAFKQYYHIFIPFHIIKLIYPKDNKEELFLLYMKVGHLYSYNKDTKKINTLNKSGYYWYFFALITVGLFFLYLTAISLSLAYVLLKIGTEDTNYLFLAIGFVALITGFYFAYFISKVVDMFTDYILYFKELNNKLEKHIETIEARQRDKNTIAILLWIGFGILIFKNIYL